MMAQKPEAEIEEPAEIIEQTHRPISDQMPLKD